jgi:serine/threonine protein kinase
LGEQGATRVVAVKLLAEDSQQGHQEFVNELKLLSQVAHRNVVPVLGFVSEGQQRCILTPFFQRGSLQAALKPDRKSQLAFGSLERVGACLDMAVGIAFLHAQEPPIWHLDLKPDNVVRDDESRGGQWKLIDFGLSKRVGEMKVSQSHLSSRNIIGTPGYIAKEFMDQGHMSPACDVFSLGISILTVATGLSVYQDGEHIRDVVQDELGDLKQQAGSPQALLLQSMLIASSSDWTFRGGAALLLRLLTLGLRCSEPRKTRRPAMPEVIDQLRTMLSEIQDQVRDCLICMAAARATVLEPCRHSVACADCTAILQARSDPCPVCREPIRSTSPVRAVLNTFIRQR